MLAADVLKHPEYQNSTWNLEPDSKGFAEVAKGRGGPFKISWEIHGTGDRLLVVSISYNDSKALSDDILLTLVVGNGSWRLQNSLAAPNMAFRSHQSQQDQVLQPDH